MLYFDDPDLGGQYMMVAEYGTNTIALYWLDANADPILTSRTSLVGSVAGPEGIVQDPVTGDFLISVYGAVRSVYRLSRSYELLTGSFDFDGYTANPSTVFTNLEIRNPGSTVAVQTLLTAAGSAGNLYTFTSVPPGTYDISVKAPHWLRKTLHNVVITSTGASGLAFNLVNGDVDEDNEISIGDYSGLSAAFGSVPGDFAWSPNADLNGDETVDVGDFSLLSANFGLTGDD